MSGRRYPLSIYVYSGEGRFLIEPIVDHEGGFGVASHEVITIENDSADGYVLGEKIQSTIEYIKKSPLVTLTVYELNKNPVWKENSKYKSEVSFWKNNLTACIRIAEVGSYKISSLKRSAMSKMYAGAIKEIELSPGSDEETIGNAILDVFKAAEDYYASGDDDELSPPRTIELLDGSRLKFYEPDDYRFTDEQDAHAAEIYQAYSYATNEGDDPFAYMCLGIAAELDCDITKEHIESVWTRLYGEPASFSVKEGEYGIFTHRAEFKNKDNRVISYLKQMSDNLLLDCTLVIESPGRHTRAIKTLVKAHDKLMSDCKFVK